MHRVATKADLETALRSVARTLAARQLARCGFAGCAGAAAALTVALLFMDLLPRVLFSATAGLAGPLALMLVGFVAGAWFELRRRSLPGVTEAALALQARLPGDAGAMAAVLRIDADHAFYNPLVTRAAKELQAALAAPAPVLIPTSKLVLTPVLVLIGALALAVALTVAAPTETDLIATDQPVADRAWANIDVASGRSEADHKALQEALGMKQAAASLRDSATTLREASSTDEKSAALANAREALTDAADRGAATDLKSDDLPATVPDNEAELEALAARLDAAADSLGDAAARIEEGKPAGSRDTAREGDFGADAKVRALVPFTLRLEAAQSPAAVAAQSPARRELAGRAVKSLEDIRNP